MVWGQSYIKKMKELSRIDYTSRGLRTDEKHYPAHKREFSCLKWAVVDKFHDYIELDRQ